MSTLRLSDRILECTSVNGPRVHWKRAQLRENTEVFNLEAAYDEALGESNAAGFVGFTPAQTIKAQSLMTMRACPKCAGVGTVPVLVGGGPDAHDEDVTCPLCNGTCVVTEIMDANSSDKHGVVLLVQDASANFNPPSA